MNSDKIFIIGLPRTGTTSMCAALLDLGFTVAHTAYTQRTFEQAQVVADTPIFSDFQLLDKYYPNSKFIYLTREPVLWLPSIQQLLLRMAKNLLRSDGGFNPIIKRCYLDTFSPLTEKNINSFAFLSQCYEQHQTQIKNYFQHRPNHLLTIDITQPSAYQHLLNFLELPIKEGSFKKMNIGGKITAWKDLIHTLKVASTNKGRATSLNYTKTSDKFNVE